MLRFLHLVLETAQLNNDTLKKNWQLLPSSIAFSKETLSVYVSWPGKANPRAELDQLKAEADCKTPVCTQDLCLDLDGAMSGRPYV